MGVGGQRHALAALPLGKRPSTQCIGGWVGPRARLDGCGKISPPPGFDPQTVQPIVSRYTDWAILDPKWLVLLDFTVPAEAPVCLIRSFHRLMQWRSPTQKKTPVINL